MIRALVILVALGLATGAFAQAPESSVRPEQRPQLGAGTRAAVTPTSQSAPMASPRPLPRPRLSVASAAPAAAPTAAPAAQVRAQDPVSAFFQSLSSKPAESGARPAAAAAASAAAVERSQRPEARPTGNPLQQLIASLAAPRATSRKGSVCGVAEIKGQAVGDVPGKGACGIEDAVKITSVSGVALASQPTIDCTTAKALNAWVREGVIPAVGRKGGGVASLKIIASYSCRTRNNRPGAKLSEHSFGHAVDVAGVVLKDGTTVTVLNNWGSSDGIIKAMHRTACGPFGTVLGPNSDRYHRDHLHVDTARYRGGPYCR